MTGGLKEQLGTLKQGDHICSIYENKAEQLAAAVPFIADALERKDRCVYIADDRTIEEVVGTLAAAGVDVEHERQRGALRLLNRQDTYLPDSEFVPQAMIDLVRNMEFEAVADGFLRLRLAGDMTWALGPEPGCNRLIEYEALRNQFLRNTAAISE